MSDAHAAKKPKTTSTGPPLYSELELAQLTVDAKLQGSNETRFATVKYKDERMVFQDGALLANNPAAIALSEARALFPGARLACLASFGTGAFEPVAEAKRSVTSFGATVQTLVRAATRTEEVHETLADLLPDSHYYRFNPSLGGQNMTLDETSAEKLRDIQDIGRKYVESGKGADDVRSLAGLLMRGGPPGPVRGTWPLRLIQRVARRSRL